MRNKLICNDYFCARFCGKVSKSLAGKALDERFRDSSTDLSTEIVDNKKIVNE